MIVQLGIIALLVAILLEVSLILSYDAVLLEGVIVGSFLTAAFLTALLSWRLIIWLKSNKNRLILAYLLASLSISASAIVGIVYLLDQLSYQPAVSYARQYGDYLGHVERGYSSLIYVYTISSAIAFVSLWIGTVFLLQSYRKRVGTKKYWIIMSVPGTRNKGKSSNGTQYPMDNNTGHNSDNHNSIGTSTTCCLLSFLTSAM